MAYKFQIGKAKLSGSIETAQAITSQGGLTVNGDVDLDAGVIGNAELANSSVMFNGVSVALGATGSFGTDAVTEGSTNKYYLDSRARAAISVTDVSGDGSLTYDSGSGVITYTGPSASEVRAHLSAGEGLKFVDGQFAVTSSIAGAGLAFSAGVLSVDTAEIAAGLSGSIRDVVADFVEGSDFVTFDDSTGTIGVSAAAFTGSARSVVSVTDNGGDGSLSYNASTGVISYTGPSAAEARAHFSAVDAGGDGSFSYDSGSGAFTYTGPSAAEARAHFSSADFIGYNSATGVFDVVVNAFTSSVRNTVGTPLLSGLSYNKSTGEFSVSSSIAGEALELTGGVLNVKTDNSSVEVSSDALRVKSSGITNTMLAGGISNDKLVNSSLTVVAGNGLVNGGLVSLGGSVTLNVSASSADAIQVSPDGIDLKPTILGNRTFTGNVTVEGDLIVTGSLTYINTTNLVVEDALITIASGSAFMADIGIELGADHSLKTVSGFADVGNALSSSLPLVAPSMKAASFYGNLVGSMQLGIETKSANATIAANVTRATANITLTLPSSPVNGQEHRVKCFVADIDSPAVVVAAQSGATIEGEASLTLQSYGAAVSLVWDSVNSSWMIF